MVDSLQIGTMQGSDGRLAGAEQERCGKASREQGLNPSGFWYCLAMTRKYRLTLIFGIAALLVIIAATAVISHTIGRIAEGNLIRLSERGIASDAVQILAAIGRDQEGPMTLNSLMEPQGLLKELPGLVERYNIVSVSVFDPNGATVWTTHRGGRDSEKHESPEFKGALEGSLASRFVPARELANLNGVRPHVAVVETYFPLRDPVSSGVMGVLDIQRNVTDEVPFLIGATRSSVVRVTLATMGGIFLALLMVVVVADVAINRSKRREQETLKGQLLERKEAADALLHSNRSLEQVVAELKDTQQQIIQQERLRALGQMASGIAHDFNNALSPIVGFSSLLLESPGKLADDESARAFLEMINTSAGDAAAVVARLREFYRKREDNEALLPIDLSEIAGQAASLTQAKWKSESQAKGITIQVNTNLQDVPPVAGNAPELREALMNLILNAVDAMSKDGTITLATSYDGEGVTLRVTDTGSGMTEEVRRSCLDPFFTTKGSHGTGMGLAMVYGIVERHEGTMQIESKLGEGTTFIIRLPVRVEGQDEAVSVIEEVESSEPLRVLVVDDEPMVRRLVVEMLTNDGHLAETAAGGAEALEIFGSSSFDLVLTDRAMPEMSGDQLAQAIKREVPDTPVILLTGFGDIMAASNEKPEGVDLVLGKPFTLLDMRRALVEARPARQGVLAGRL